MYIYISKLFVLFVEVKGKKVRTIVVLKLAGIGEWFKSSRVLVASFRTGILPKSNCGF